MNLHAPISNTNNVYKLYATRLEKLTILTLYDLLYHVPFRYDDFSFVTTIANAPFGKVVTITGTVEDIRNVYTSRLKKLQQAIIKDHTGTMEVVWFNQPYLTKTIHKGDTISLSGRIEQTRGTGKKSFAPTFISPEYEIITGTNKGIHTGRLVPIYPETKGVSSKWLRRQIYNLLQNMRVHNASIVGANDYSPLQEFLPEDVLRNHNFPDVLTALQTIHFPQTLEQAQQARLRLAFDELFLLQLNAIKKRAEWKQKTIGNGFTITKHQKHIDLFQKSLPFILTHAQQQAVAQIFEDLEKSEPMNRLLQGDVGSGKTVVSAIAMYAAYLNGFQSVLMAPTEILAQQHYDTIKRLLEPLGLKIDIATSSQKSIGKSMASKTGVGLQPAPKRFLSTSPSNAKSEIQSTVVKNRFERGNIPLPASGVGLAIGSKKHLTFDILVGTHAVLNDSIRFDKLGLIIIDEQQRFGVEQRAILRNKGNNPHVLSMTATPIPRTIALTIYGDLDVSLLNEMPKGRKLIKTWLVPHAKRNSAYNWIRKQVKETDSQIFLICPFIEESETMQTIKAAQKEYETLKKDIFPDLQVGLLHGKLKLKEKDQVLQDFREKKYDILVATPVVEVGIDIPNATVIMIEAAERFGLAQLHQLRGRVGRGEKQSYCLLFTDSTNPQTLQRLKAMETIHVGNELAELDLKLRGSGDMYGTQQSGFKMLKIANFSDTSLIEKAKFEAKKIFPNLDSHPKLLKKLEETNNKQIAPD